VEGDYITSGAGDAGPTVSLPLHVPRGGLYRLWVQYHGRPNSRAVTFLKIYRQAEEARGPIVQPDELYDMPAEVAGPQWHDILVDLPAGDLVIQLGHVTRGGMGRENTMGAALIAFTLPMSCGLRRLRPRRATRCAHQQGPTQRSGW